MTDRINGGSPAVHPQPYHTVPTAVIVEACQRDRYLNHSETRQLSAFFSTGLRRLEIAQVLTQQAEKIVAAGANRIFVGGNAMAYLERPEEPLGMPGSGYYVGEDYLSAAARAKRQSSSGYQGGYQIDSVNGIVEWFKGLLAGGKPNVPSSFRTIDISRYGNVRMKRSMRDLSWFLRYVTYAIVAGDTSIISVNTRGLRGVIPEDVTLATVVALREMQWKALTYFPSETAAALVRRYFDVLITDYWVEKPAHRLRAGVSKHHQGLELPQSYGDSDSPRPRWVMKPDLPDIEKNEAVRAAYRQVFERDITHPYGAAVTELASQVKSGQGPMKEFIRQLGKSRLYRQLYYEPFTISRSIELGCRHFLGRGLSCLEEFQTYFDVISERGFPALVDAFIDSQEYADYFGEETVPYLRGLGMEAQECRNWGPQLDLFKYSAPMRKVPQFVTTFAGYQQPLPNQHPYGQGNDPLEIQFGAIFPQENRDPKAQPAHFSEDSRRILISSGDLKGRSHDAGNGTHGHTDLGRVPGSAEQVWSLSPPSLNNGHSLEPVYRRKDDSAPVSFNSARHSPEEVILATYRQVFGREVFESQRHSIAESQLKGGLITLREFVRQLAQSAAFRRLYWEQLYVTKAVEYIHRRLLGRPTYGRRELNRYYDICGRQGFYALIDAIVDSAEYAEVFGEDTVPYERYVTPRGLAMRSPQGPVAWSKPRVNPPTAGRVMMGHRADGAGSATATMAPPAQPDDNDQPAKADEQPAAASTAPDGEQPSNRLLAENLPEVSQDTDKSVAVAAPPAVAPPETNED